MFSLLLPLPFSHLFSHSSQNDLLWDPPMVFQIIPRKGAVSKRCTAWPCYLWCAPSHSDPCSLCSCVNMPGPGQPLGLLLAIPSASTTLPSDVSTAGSATSFKSLLKSHSPNRPFLTTLFKVAIPVSWHPLTSFSVLFSLMVSNKVHIIFMYFVSFLVLPHRKVSSVLYTRFT